MPRMKVTGPKVLPVQWKSGELWQVVGHDGQFPFMVRVIVSDGVVRSAPPLGAWMMGRTWLDVAETCALRGWMVSHLDTDLARLREQEKARNDAGVTQLGLEL